MSASTEEGVQLDSEQDNALIGSAGGDIGGEENLPKAETARQGGKKSKTATTTVSSSNSRSFDYVMRSIAGLSPEEKLEALGRKYAEIYDQSRANEEKLKAASKQLATATRERDHLQSEHSKSLLAKSKLEGLCRELQKHCKVVKDESLNRAKEEEERRKEVSGQLQTTISDIQTQMQEHSTRNNKLRDENTILVDKMRGLVEKYEKREEFVEKLLRQHELQAQLAEARLAQEKAQGDADRVRMSDEIRRMSAQIELYAKQEKALNDQIGFYTAKYEDFQKAITKSNEMFATFKTQIDDLTKKLRRIEKERNQWKERCEASANSVLQLAEDKATKEALITALRAKVDTLEKLCRALQLERRTRKEGSADVEASTKSSTPELESSAPPPTDAAVVVVESAPQPPPQPQPPTDAAVEVVESASPSQPPTDAAVEVVESAPPPQPPTDAAVTAADDEEL